MAPRVVSSAEVIASNDDLLAEIFVRLPVRPLIRFQCVSKQWLALISGRSFSHRHARRNIRSASALFLRRSSYGRSRYGLMEPEFEFDFVSFGGASDADDPLKSIGFVEIPSGLTILQSCNGLLLCSSRGCVDSNFLYYIYNPSTSKFLELPALVGGDSPTVLAINLAFDPAKSPNYQVVCVRSTEVSVYCYQTEIYSSETGKWRLSGAPFTSQLRMVFGKGVFWNGSSIWVGLGKVFYYNLEQERFGTIPLPFELEGTRFQYFGESGGHLHLIELCESPIVHFKVFEMEKDYCGWRVKYQIDLRPIRNAFTEVYPEYHAPFYNVGYFTFFVLSLVREEDDDAASLVLHIPGKIILFNLKDMSYKRLQDVEPTCGDIKGSLQYGWDSEGRWESERKKLAENSRLKGLVRLACS